MEKNYMYDLTVEELARYTGRSVATFKRDFSKVSELSPRNWLIRRRLEAAHQLLLTTDSPINRILTDVGFKNFSHFSKVYRAYFGVTPSETRQKRT
jgi:transcriptional regulator GlxA family with amidase domain